jgi:hypothetical protein
MVEPEGGQWNVATKKNTVYLERVSEDNKQLFDDSLAPEEARQLARLLRKHADKISESDDSDKDSDDEDEDAEDKDEDSDDDSDEDDEDSDDKKDKKDKEDKDD